MGIFEEGDYFAQADLNSFYAKYTSYIPTGWAPKVNGVDGGTAPVAVSKAGGESNLDFELAIPIIYPQTTVDYQTDDAYYAAGGGSASGIFNTFFDALDGSYCSKYYQSVVLTLFPLPFQRTLVSIMSCDIMKRGGIPLAK